MSASMGPVLDRLARATSTIRVRAEDAQRQENNGGSPAELQQRVEAAVAEVERAARKLTRVLA